MIFIPIRDLKPIRSAAHDSPRPSLSSLSDDELLEAATDPKRGDHLIVNTRTGILVDGNGRAHELLRRASDPGITIDGDTLIPVQEYTPDTSMFPDLD